MNLQKVLAKRDEAVRLRPGELLHWHRLGAISYSSVRNRITVELDC